MAGAVAVADEEQPAMLRRTPSRMGSIAIMNKNIMIDDEDASIVIVFPRGTSQGGAIDENAMVQDPMGEAHKVFVRPQNVRTVSAWEDNFVPFTKGPVTMKVFQDTLRKVLLEILMNSGLQASVFESIDRDEIFLKLALKRNGSVIQQLAQRYQYRLPFTHAAYTAMEPFGAYPGKEPMKNGHGNPVPAYTAFEFELKEQLQGFRDVDEIRLLEIRFDEWVSISQLLQLGIISKFFPAAKHDTVQKLHEEWAGANRILALPNSAHDDEIRDYFGEEIAFFFRWFAFYARMLVPLGILGLVCHLSGMPEFGLDVRVHRYLRIVFGFALVAWASIYNQTFKNRDARATQRWGMKDFDSLSVERAQYRPELEGTWQLWLSKTFANLVLVGTCVFFVAAVTTTEALKKHGLESGDDFWAVYGAYTTVLLIKVTSASWSKVAPKLANMQNHRTQTRWNNALTTILTTVKLFVALFPFVNLAFLKKYTSPVCKADLMSAAAKIYGNTGWPTGIAGPPAGTNLTAADLGFLQGYTYSAGGKECIYGCHPVSCQDPAGGVEHCTTDCREALEEQLLLVYITHVVSTVIFLLIPVVLTRISMHREMAKVSEKKEPADEVAKKALLAEGDNTYSFLQFQAKCYDQACYEYASWGGSQVEDFLELAVGFALLTCFGILVPVMALIGAIAHIVEYRLLAYRMTNVTCRPIPRGAEGIGAWQGIFENISIIAVAINVGLAVFFTNPMQTWTPMMQFAGFIILEHAMLFVKAVLTAAIPDEPQDVQRIDDFNNRFKAKFVKRPPLDIPEEERCNMRDLDVGLHK